jgi:hypothetical protein
MVDQPSVKVHDFGLHSKEEGPTGPERWQGPFPAGPATIMANFLLVSFHFRSKPGQFKMSGTIDCAPNCEAAWVPAFRGPLANCSLGLASALVRSVLLGGRQAIESRNLIKFHNNILIS